ncbi:MAG: recombinase family protein [Oscillospiraceae bacterium]|nr:recombinase family protein [Oscillospiraceae bacterium]
MRLSIEDGNDESYSVRNQRRRLKEFLGNLIPEEEMQLADVYIDDGCTGTDSDRESFQRMLEDIDAGVVNCVIVKDLSRLSRNDWECKKYLQQNFLNWIVTKILMKFTKWVFLSKACTMKTTVGKPQSKSEEHSI